MGVIRNVYDPFCTGVGPEESLDDILEAAQHEDAPIRRSKRVKRRANPAKPENTTENAARCKSGKKHRRIENVNYLLSLAGEEEAREITIYDFVPETISAFTQLLMEKESMQAWNDFINRSDDEQWLFLGMCDQKITLLEPEEGSVEDADKNLLADGRCAHPAFTAEDCFKKIDGDLRNMLRKRHVPLGTIAHLETEVSTYFRSHPRSVFRLQLGSSFERLMLHALCQYMDLSSISYDDKGSRWTKVHNHHRRFHTPQMMLSAYLEWKAKPANPRSC